MRTLEGISADAIGVARIAALRLAEAPPSAGTIVLIEREPLLADSIKYTLEREGYRVVASTTIETAVEVVTLERPALVLIELPGPTLEALKLCRRLRASTAAPIILMTPPVADAARAEALDSGADDLLFKPFSLREVVHRVTHQLRRNGARVLTNDSDVEWLRAGPVEMDLAKHEVWVRGKLTFFPPKEFGLLETLVRSRGRLLTRARLISTVWGAGYYGDGKTLDTHVKRLRQKIELDPKRPDHLIVVRGLGYRFLEAER